MSADAVICPVGRPLSEDEWAERGWRLAAIRATLPSRCPQCGSRRIWPPVDWRVAFDGRRCEDCGALFSRGD